VNNLFFLIVWVIFVGNDKRTKKGFLFELGVRSVLNIHSEKINLWLDLGFGLTVNLIFQSIGFLSF